jgi:hypothetical protein
MRPAPAADYRPGSPACDTNQDGPQATPILPFQYNFDFSNAAIPFVVASGGSHERRRQAIFGKFLGLAKQKEVRR